MRGPAQLKFSCLTFCALALTLMGQTIGEAYEPSQPYWGDPWWYTPFAFFTVAAVLVVCAGVILWRDGRR